MASKMKLLTMAFWMILVIMSCSNNGMFLGMNQTNVELSEANYEMVATNLVGESQAGYLLGFSWSIGSSAQTLALARVEGTGMLYKEALEDLWNKFEKDYGKSEGRKLALANVRYDSELLNLFLYTGIKVFVRADIVEFK
jgi:hypothetical protein